MKEFFPLLNIILLPVIYYLIRVEHRLTKIETLLKIGCGRKG
jgi:hypothetical protein